MARADDENPPPPVVTPTQQAPHTVSTIKLPILKKGWSRTYGIEKEHYLALLYPIWSLLSQLEIHGAGVSFEDANKKFLSAQNVAFVSSESTSSTNDVSTAMVLLLLLDITYKGKTLHHTLMNSCTPSLLINLVVAMRLKKFYKKTWRKLQFDAKEPVGFDKTKVECFNLNTGYKSKDNGKRPGKQEEPKALVTLYGDGVDWTGHAENEQENFALMAYNNSGSDTE
ncbi:hypothetical protein Tco_1432566, partial [Tanacetum coccineum]